jgi:hypothetical protein
MSATDSRLVGPYAALLDVRKTAGDYGLGSHNDERTVFLLHVVKK